MKYVIAVFLTLTLIACAGTPFNFENARQVKVGMVESEVTNLMGSPYLVTTKGEEQIWVWSYANGMSGASKSISFVMKDGKVISVPTIPDSFK
ncbi:outer membrane protein assembly factor BamE [Rheinheimera sp.]|uniref:outer membrane protein assembly factor BamE domain-containing protein n=1 Tax=Rheinheimera sp. TaxID=1869214 RepID=UPI0027BA4376|nr:outer membrane protein assembly factor BamE [Rheinheimera sp.]